MGLGGALGRFVRFRLLTLGVRMLILFSAIVNRKTDGQSRIGSWHVQS